MPPSTRPEETRRDLNARDHPGDGAQLMRELKEVDTAGIRTVRFPTYRKYQVMSTAVTQMNVREKRNVFQYMRDQILAPEKVPEKVQRLPFQDEAFLPQYGLTVGEFSLFQIMQ